MDEIKENHSVRQRPDEGFRRWYVNRFFDIIFWFDQEGGDLIGFQVCYSKNNNEKAFTWGISSNSHHYVSSRPAAQMPATAILKGHAGIVPQAILDQLKAEQGELPAEYLNLILDRAAQFNHHISTN